MDGPPKSSDGQAVPAAASSPVIGNGKQGPSERDQAGTAANGIGRPEHVSTEQSAGGPVEAHDTFYEEGKEGGGMRGASTRLNHGVLEAGGQMELAELPLTTYFDALDNKPVCFFDLAQAPYYASEAAGRAHYERGGRPVRPYSNPCMLQLMAGRSLFVEALTPTSMGLVRKLAREIDRTGPPKTLALDFIAPWQPSPSESQGQPTFRNHATDSADLVTVNFEVTRLENSAMPRSLRPIFNKGILVLVGSILTEDGRLPREFEAGFQPRPSASSGSSPSKGQHAEDTHAPRSEFVRVSRPLKPQLPVAKSVGLQSTQFWSDIRQSQASAESNLTSAPSQITTPQPANVFDWTGMAETNAAISSSETGRMFLAHPWEQTSMGPLASWPPQYRLYVTFLMSLPFAACIGLGSAFTFLYNDKYRDLLGPAHPEVFGKPAEEAWGDVWNTSLAPVVERVCKGKKSYRKENHLVWMRRLNLWRDVKQGKLEATSLSYNKSLALEETYHTFSYTPLLPDCGSDAVGFLGIDTETTMTVIAQRRLATARELGIAMGPNRNLREFYKTVADSLEANPIDVPYLLVYSCRSSSATMMAGAHEDASSLQGAKTTGTTVYSTLNSQDDTSEIASTSQWNGTYHLILQSSFGLKDEARAKYNRFSVDMSEGLGAEEEEEAGAPFNFKKAFKTMDPIHSYLNDNEANDFMPRSWDQPSHQAVTMAVRTDHRKVPSTIIVIGLNSRRTYNKVYRRWLEELGRAMSSGLSTVRILEREQRHLANLRKLDEAKTTFFTSVSHELRSPLTLIQGPAQDALSEGNLSPKDLSRFTLIARASGRLLRLVNSLLDFASVEAGKTAVAFRPVHLKRFVEDLASLFRSAAERAGLGYSVTCEGADAIAYTDLSAYEKIFFNLLSNALKYTRSGSIGVHYYSTTEYHMLEIRDTGLGIPESELPHIFKRFHRVSTPHGRSIEGTGIGLALTKELARLIRGELSVESKVATSEGGGGSTFRLCIPTGYSHLPEELLDMSAQASDLTGFDNTYSRRAIADELANAFENEATVSADGSEDGGPASGEELAMEREASVLVVDDNADVRGYVSSILASVTAVSDGEAALAILKTNVRVDLVVSDVMMPRMDGFQLLAAIRADDRLKQLPVILLSARAGAEASAEGIELGATDYLPKPFASKELTARVRNALQNAKNSKRLELLIEERTAELAASEKRAVELLNVLPIGVYQANTDGLVTWANPAWRAMSSWPEDRFPFHIMEWLERVHEDDTQAVKKVIDKALDETFVHHSEVRSEREPLVADWRWKGVQGAPPHWCFGQIYWLGDSFVGVLTDITPSKRLAEQSLQYEKQRTADALSLARSQESFLDVVSHELRNPLSAILNAADLANSNHDAIAQLLDRLQSCSDIDEASPLHEDIRMELDEAAESVQGIIASARHQSLIAGDILSVSRFNKGLLTVTPVDIALLNELRTIMSMFEIQTRNNGISLRLHHGTNIDDNLSVSADPTRLNQILVNLISNSCRILETFDGPRSCVLDVRALRSAPSLGDFHPKTDPALELTVKEEIPADCPVGTEIWLLFLIRDTGPGISEQTQARLFTKFNRVQDKTTAMDATRSAVGGGSGLGLYLAKKLAELMGGSITVVSEVNQGADFIFYIKSARARFVRPRKAISAARARNTRVVARSTTPVGVSASPRSQDVTAMTAMAAQETAASNYGTDLLGQDDPETVGSADDGQVAESHISVDQPLRILVVEDNLLNQKLLHRQLTKAGHVVTVASNGLEAIARLREAQEEQVNVDLCLMDLEMPLMGGLEASMKVRELEASGELKGRRTIIALTGNAREFFITEAKRAGMDDVITKPYRFPDIQSKLRNLSVTSTTTQQT